MKTAIVLLVCFVLGFAVAAGCAAARQAMKDPAKREAVAGGLDKGGATATGVAAERFTSGDWLGGSIAALLGVGAAIGAGYIRKKYGPGSRSTTPDGSSTGASP